MLTTTASLSAFAVLAIGLLVFWSNPHRIINRGFVTFSLHMAGWLVCVHFAVSRGEDPFWIRAASSLGAFMALHMWLVKEINIGAHGRSVEILRRSIGWIVASLVLLGICLSDWYVLPISTAGGRPQFGHGYFAYMIGFVTLFLVLARETSLQIRVQSGLTRLELQILFLGGIAALFALVVLMGMRAVLDSVWPIHVQPLVLLAFYSLTVVAITTHRIFDARQVVLVATQKLVLVAVASGLAFALDTILNWLGLGEPFALLVTVGITLWLVALLNGSLQRSFQFYAEATAARQAAFTVAREARVENLEAAFRAVLKGWGKSEHAVILSGTRDLLSGSGIEMPSDNVVLATMQQLRWATPERLARERPTADRDQVSRFLKEHKLGILTIAEGPALTILAGVGINASRMPFTYPQVLQLIELASIIESALERAHFSVKAQHAEQLATVGLLGASLAHEIRNPLVSIKTFVQLLPTHHQDPAFREKFFRLIGDEVTRIDQLTEQLLDLASPRTYTASFIELHPILKASLDLVATKAVHRNVQFLTEFNAVPDRAFTDASAAKQVMLNLCFNAIQAVELRDGERWIKISTRNTDGGVEMAVEDSGPGIAAEIRPRLFQPFQTTKSTGFGLGLAICSDILTNLNATISVDPPVSGRGAAFRVLFPCQPSSS